jgi:predicted signal transduction protein with EAL and GGDEF domain
MKVGVSVGIAVNHSRASDGEQLLRDADTAMYVAKSRGKNRYEFANGGKDETVPQSPERGQELFAG